MKQTIDYYLSLISPWSYLGHQRLLDIAQRHEAEIRIWPMDFSIVFPSTGGIPLPKRSPERKAYRLQELRRWSEHLDIPLTIQPKFFPVSDKLAASMVVNIREQQSEAAFTFAGACLRACWVEERDISNRNTLIEIAQENHLDGVKLLSDSDSCIETIAADSQDAIAAGVFGAPTYRLDEEIFWGQDRLEFLQRALQN